MLVIVQITGHLFYLKLILYGTKEDPLTNNRHVNRGIKNTEKVQVDQRKRGQSV